MIKKTKYYSWKLNNLADGCEQCIKGQKLVMFVTGICPRQCSYCPLSEHKKDHDVIFANERQLNDEDDIKAVLEEVRACKSEGAGFTGGDPLTRIDRTCNYIRLLKKNFGKRFHIHLYTSMELLDEKNLSKLNDAGLDELRLHPELYNNKLWHKISLFYDTQKRKYDFRFGIEIPVLPDSYGLTKGVIDCFINWVDFINLNELEISDAENFKLRNVKTRNRSYYGAKGSQETALKLLKYIDSKYPKSNVHFCTCKLKDKAQLGNRLRTRALNTKKIFDIVTDDGTVIRGAIYLKELSPGFGYRRKINEIINTKEIFKKLEQSKNIIIKKYSVPKRFIETDQRKFRLITNIGIVEQLSKDLKSLGMIPAVVEQYPTWDQMEVDITFL
ncbi:TPA: radical SAM protein [Candidatus Woesearchaeota archaeon]|nr:radical SAM protein [Candidatus Woesearchaeota archaeon]HIH31125.1 radical SAM protein [Candidatus Woesearchaeota archaeon]HIH54606.1 radical SAM protein [Candidatus Woesearchaeota archaeon]HIJ02340.1 radical SAM protein [Candidatus Woesearchaeota archaeon]HIJ14182.1 radical SAM protein [Candidatus Woesearchaeota archaeon]